MIIDVIIRCDVEIAAAGADKQVQNDSSRCGVPHLAQDRKLRTKPDPGIPGLPHGSLVYVSISSNHNSMLNRIEVEFNVQTQQRT
jgi:hypothetical protein